MPATMCAHWMGVIKTKPKGEKMSETIVAGVTRFESNIWVRKHFQRV